MTHENLESVPERIQSDILKNLISHKNENTKLQLNSNTDPTVFVNQPLIYELQGRSSNDTHLKNCLNCDSVLNFKVGIYEKEKFVYYNEEVSQDYIFVSRKKFLFMYYNIINTYTLYIYTVFILLIYF